MSDIRLVVPRESAASHRVGRRPAEPVRRAAAGVQDTAALVLERAAHDFTYLHPEVLDQRCTVRGDTLTLDNPGNPETYRVVVIPGSKTIAIGTLTKIKQFYDQGGRVIATTRLPDKSAELRQDAKVREMIQAIFGVDPQSPVVNEMHHDNARGGEAWFLPQPSAEAFGKALGQSLAVFDVTFEGSPGLTGGNLSYTHKRREGKNVYFFANSSSTAVDVPVVLRGRLDLEAWDPHTGQIKPVECAVTEPSGQAVTRVRLSLPAVRSVFFIEK